jgi:hypothetical protein
MSIHTNTNKWNPMKAIQSGAKCKQDEPKMHRAVSFSRTNKTYKVLAIDDYSDKEIASTWYNGEENHLIVHKCQKIIRRMKNNVDIGKYCVRGLERMSGARKESLNRNRCNAYDAVLYEQEAQFKTRRDDQELIAKLYHAVCAQCQVEATEMGLSDEYAAVDRRHFMRDERRVRDLLPKPKMDLPKKDLLPPSAQTPIRPLRRQSFVASTA